MRRRDLLALVAGASTLRPFVAAAQQKKLPVIGILIVDRYKQHFVQELNDLGYIEGETVHFEYRPLTPANELPRFAAELVGLKVNILVAIGSEAARAAQHATQTTPIVIIASDPVRIGLVANLARPGGNITGVSLSSPELSGKRLQLLQAATGSLSRVAALWDPDDPPAALSLKETETAASALGITVHPVEVRRPEDFDAAFATATEIHSDAIVLMPSPLMSAHPRELAASALRHRLPSTYWQRAYTVEGGLMSYGPDIDNLVRRATVYVDKILKGAKPADLPVEQPTKFELVINLKTAKALGLVVPQSLLQRADDVIE